MQVIGINGRPGAGKTTVSNMLFSDDDTMVFHLDNMFDNMKIKYFKRSIKILRESDGTQEPYIDSKSSIGRIARFKYTKLVLNKMKKAYANIHIENLIKKNRFSLDYLVIEGRTLDIYNLGHFCDVKLFINSEESERYTRMINRTIGGLSQNDIAGIFLMIWIGVLT